MRAWAAIEVEAAKHESDDDGQNDMPLTLVQVQA